MIILFLFGETIILLSVFPLLKNNGKEKTEIYEKQSLHTAIEKIYDAVVLLQSYKEKSLKETGTGFIYKVDDKYGYILTNEHVISECDTVKATLSTKEEINVTILGKDEFLDLAVLRIDKEKVQRIATIGNSTTANLGDTIFTVGSPLGLEYQGSITSGIISGKDRLVSMSVISNRSNDWIMKVLQIDASINPGNSGGPLLNVNGEVIGIITFKLVKEDIEGMGFAIPIENAMDYVDLLEKKEKIDWPVLGIGMEDISEVSIMTKKEMSIPEEREDGVVVTSVKEKSVASSKLKEGDVIIKINGKSVKNIAYFRYELYQYKSGDTIHITCLREGKEINSSLQIK